MSATNKRKRFLTVKNQIRITVALIVLTAAAVVTLLVLRNDPLYKETESKGLYDATDDIAAANARLGDVKAELLQETDDRKHKVKIVFEGTLSPDATKKIIDMLKANDMQAVFCASTVDSVENADSLELIRDAGYMLGSYCMNGESHMEALTTNGLISAFCMSAGYMESSVGMRPSLVRCFDTQVTDGILKAAYACGYTSVVDTQNEVGIKSFSSFSSVEKYVNKLEAGSIVACRLTAETGTAAGDEPERTGDAASPAGDAASPAPEVTTKPSATPKPTTPGSNQISAPADEGDDATPSPGISATPASATAMPNVTTTVPASDTPMLTPSPTAVSTEKPEMSEKPEHEADWVDMSQYSDVDRAIQTVEWLIRANAEADYSGEAEGLKAANAGKTAPLQKTLYTTKRGVCLLFGGMEENNEELTKLLQTLDSLDAVATFAVTFDEAKTCGEAINAVVAAGHSVEVAVRPKEDSDFYKLCSRILLTRKLLNERYGAETGALCITLGAVNSPVMAEAASAAGCEQIGYHSAVSQAVADRGLTPAELMSKTFRNPTACLKRGHIFYFPLNNYDAAGTVSELVKIVYTERNIYEACPLRELVEDKALRYEYPVPKSAWQRGTDDIGAGHIVDESLLMDIIAMHYLGCTNASSEENLPGFTADERGRLNKDGLIETTDRVVFLTFDDWGTDADIDPLLEMLKAHNAHGTFFVRSNHVDANPNLLRAIAADGNDVGSHTHEHLPLSIQTEDETKYISLTEEEAAALEADLCTSWYALADVLGDMNVSGHSSLVKIFRPPTLAVSKAGLRSVFDLGFYYVASGSYSSHDYEAESAQALFDALLANLKPGAVFVMHMSANAKFTPAALEMLFKYNEALPAEERYEFGLLGDYLDGVATITPAY